MDVSCKRREITESDNPQSGAPGKRQRLNSLNSELNGKYWQRASSRRKLALGSRLRHIRPEAPGAPSTSSLIVRPIFDVGLPIVFGEPRAQEQHQSEQPFAALQRLGGVLNPESPVYEVEEPESPPHQVPSRPRSLPAPQSAPARSEQDLITLESANAPWEFTPSWDAIRIGSRILGQALALPFTFARYLVNVAPETRRQARQIEAARREQEAREEQQLIEHIIGIPFSC
jgi:hypothetical protein